MTQNNLYGDNANRRYPIQSVAVPDNYDNRWIVDAGFTAAGNSQYSHADSNIMLQSIYREDSQLTIKVFAQHVTSSTPAVLIRADLEAGDYQTAYSGAEFGQDLQGFLVLGKIEHLSRIPNGTVLNFSGLPFEPALTINRVNTQVTSISFANRDRTRSYRNRDRPEFRNYYMLDLDLAENLKLVEGHNVTIAYTTSGGMRFIVEAGNGKGLSCGDIPVHAEEEVDELFGNFEGVPGCNQVLRSFNGVGGPAFDFQSSSEAGVIIDQENSTVSIDLSVPSIRSCMSAQFDPEPIEEEFEDLSEFE